MAGRIKVALATRNAGKIAELADALASFGIIPAGLDALPQIGEIAETGSTFEENALIKATAVASATGMIAIADDSGLVVEALNGAPGIYSARYGDDWAPLPGESRDSRNIRKLLANMQGIPDDRRQAHFETAMAAVAPGGETLVAHGAWHGKILAEPVGVNGFGYDPVFFDPELGRGAAQLDREEKNLASHRGKALRQLLAGWGNFLKNLR